jgi:hypothetical protein
VSKDNKNTNQQADTPNQVELSGLVVGQTESRLVSVKVDSTTARVTSQSDPNVHAWVKIFHPSMLLAD